jgi:hypothetical protein
MIYVAMIHLLQKLPQLLYLTPETLNYSQIEKVTR